MIIEKEISKKNFNKLRKDNDKLIGNYNILIIDTEISKKENEKEKDKITRNI